MEAEDISVALAHHEERLNALEREITEIKEVQSAIRNMNEALVVLANEVKHMGAHLVRHEEKLDSLESAPREARRQILTATLAALAAALATAMISLLFG